MQLFCKLSKNSFCRAGMAAGAVALSLGILLSAEHVKVIYFTSVVQTVANNSALSAARVLPLANATATEIETVRREHIGCTSGLTVYRDSQVDGRNVHVVSSNIEGLTGLQVSVEVRWSSMFGDFSPLNGTPIIAGAEVRLLGARKFEHKAVPATSVVTRADKLGQQRNKLRRCSA